MQYGMSRVFAGPFLRLLGRPEITGLEHIPAEGGAILASNHLSIVDSIFLPLMVDRPVTFAAKSEYFTGTRPIDRITSAYMRATNQLSVDRAQARAFSLSMMPGNRRRSSMAAESSPCSSKMARIASASVSVTRNIPKGWQPAARLGSRGPHDGRRYDRFDRSARTSGHRTAEADNDRPATRSHGHRHRPGA